MFTNVNVVRINKVFVSLIQCLSGVKEKYSLILLSYVFTSETWNIQLYLKYFLKKNPYGFAGHANISIY